MKQDIFDQVGKRTPYRVPEGFFEQTEKNLQQLAVSHRPSVVNYRRAAHRTSSPRTWLYSAAAAVLLLLAVGGVWQYVQQQMPVDVVYVSDGNSYDSSWEDFAEADVFLDNLDW